MGAILNKPSRLTLSCSLNLVLMYSKMGGRYLIIFRDIQCPVVHTFRELLLPRVILSITKKAYFPFFFPMITEYGQMMGSFSCYCKTDFCLEHWILIISVIFKNPICLKLDHASLPIFSFTWQPCISKKETLKAKPELKRC